MQLAGNVFTCRHGIKQFLGGILGMAGHETNAEVAFDLVDLGQQVGEIVVDVQVIAVGVDVLAQQGDILVTCFHQLFHFSQHAFGIAAALPAADIGNDAVRTEVIAAIHDGDPCLHALFTDHRNALGDGAVLICHGEDTLAALIHLPQQFRELPQGMGTKHQIHQRIGLLNALGHAGLLCHAATQADDHLRIFLLGVGQCTQVTKHAILRMLADGAGVQDHQIRFGGLVRQGKTAVCQHAHQLLAVCHVLLAAKGIHAGHRMSLA